MAKVTAYSALSPVLGTDLLMFVSDPGGTPTTKKGTVNDLFAALPQAIDAAATPSFARLYLASASLAFDLGFGALGVGALLSHGSTVTIAASKQYDHVRLSKNDGGYNVFSIGNGGIVAGMEYALQSETTSHAGSNLYGVIGVLSNKGPGTTKSVYGRTNMETGCTGVGIAGVFALRAVSGATAWILQLTGTSNTDFAAYIHSDDGIGVAANFNDGIVYDSGVRMEAGGAFFKAFQTGGHDGDFLAYKSQLGADLFRVDKDGQVAAPNIVRRLATVTIDMDDVSNQDVYTVPAGNGLIVMYMVPRDANADMTGQAIRVYSSETANRLISADLMFLATPNGYDIITLDNENGSVDAREIIGAGFKVQAHPKTAYGSPATIVLDLFGYFI